MSNFFVGLAVFLITVIGSLFAIPHFVDWNNYRDLFEDEASRFLGRDVRVSGDVNLHLLPTPYFRLERVRIADPSGNLREPFFRADSLEFKLSIAPLLRGVVEANEIEFRRPVLRLAHDHRGVWNWQSFGAAFANAAYLPTNVAITSLKITDGVLAAHRSDGTELVRLEGVDGELSAPAIDGPYRFRGTVIKGGAEREIRIATAKPDGEAGVRFRASVRLAETGAVYVIDSRLLDLMGKPRLDGELTARIPLAAVRGPVKAAAGDRDTVAVPALDVKGMFEADATGGSLRDLSLSFEQDGRPQLVTGQARASWQEGIALDVSLASRWLDLDKIAGAGEGTRPIDSIVPFVTGAKDLLPAGGRVRASLSIDQANLGREAVSGIHLVAAHARDKIEIESLRAGLPGGSHAELRGVLTGLAGSPEFDGNVAVRGTSPMRTLDWAFARAEAQTDARAEGAFGINAQLALSEGRARVRNIVGSLLGTPIYGEADWRWAEQHELSLRIEAPQIDLRPFGSVDPWDAVGFLTSGMEPAPGAGSQTAQSTAARQRRPPDIRLSFEAGQVVTQTRTYRDVALRLNVNSGNLDLPLLRLSDDRGLLVDIKGALKGIAERPRGTLSGTVAAANATDVADLAELLNVPPALRPDSRLARAMSPLRLAGSAVFGARAGAPVDLNLAGEANGATVEITARLDRTGASWRDGTVDITATVDAPDGRRIAAFLSDGLDTPTEKPGAGSILFKAKGVPAQGLSAIATIAAADLALDLNGAVTVLDTGSRFAGDLRVKAADGGRLAAVAGLAPLPLAGVAVEGSLRLTAGEGAVKLEQMALDAGGSEVRGRISLSRSGEKRKLDARLDVSELTAASLLAPLLDQRLAAITGAAEAAISGRQNPWPDEPFDIGGLANTEGRIALGVQRLVLADGVALKDAKLDIALEGARIDVKGIEGGMLGGRGRIAMQIAGSGAGAEANGTLSLSGGKLETLLAPAPSSKAGTDGRFDATLAFSGRGSNPRGLIAALHGDGRIEADGRVAGLWPGAIGLATERALKSDAERLRAAVREAVEQGLSSGRLTLPKEIGLQLADGQLRSPSIAIETANGKASGTAALNLQTLMFDTEWRLEQAPAPQAGPGSKPPLPAVVVGYAGPVAALGRTEPRIDTEALERELSVRKMEHDVEELERMRQLDEARRRSEAERMRREMESLPPPAPLPLPMPVAPVTPPRPATPG